MTHKISIFFFLYNIVHCCFCGFLFFKRRGDRRLHFAWIDTDTMGRHDGSKEAVEEQQAEEVHITKLRKWYSATLGKSDWIMLACRPTKAKGCFFDVTTNDGNINFEQVERWIDGLTDGATSLKKME